MVSVDRYLYRELKRVLTLIRLTEPVLICVMLVTVLLEKPATLGIIIIIIVVAPTVMHVLLLDSCQSTLIHIIITEPCQKVL